MKIFYYARRPSLEVTMINEDVIGRYRIENAWLS